MQHPPADLEVPASLVRDLLAEQHPDLADLRLTALGEGWDNVTVRAGTEYAVRLPRREVAVPLTHNEQRWLPALTDGLPLQIPEVVRLGRPSPLFPWPWTVVRWVDGETADRTPVRDDQAQTLAEFLVALHQPAPPDAPRNPYRGVPLAERSDIVTDRLARLGLDDLGGLWRRALEAAPAPERRWLHGDLHPRNVVARDGEISGIIDWGDLNGGDIATDLACAWMLFDMRAARLAFLDAYGADADAVQRAAGWAVNFASAFTELDNDALNRIGPATAEHLMDDLRGGHLIGM